MNVDLKYIPPRTYTTYTDVMDAFNGDIISTIKKSLPVAVDQMKALSPSFKGRNVLETASNIWHWIKRNLRYKRDANHDQIVKIPSLLLASRAADCKSFSLFTAAILENLGIPYVFRYTNETGKSIPSHVYIVAFDESGREIPIDGVWKYFNSEKAYRFKKDLNHSKDMRVRAIGGFGSGRKPSQRKRPVRGNNSDLARMVRGHINGFADIFDQAIYVTEDVFAPGTGAAHRVAAQAAPKSKPSNIFSGEIFKSSKPSYSNVLQVDYWDFITNQGTKQKASQSYFMNNIKPGQEQRAKEFGFSSYDDASKTMDEFVKRYPNYTDLIKAQFSKLRRLGRTDAAAWENLLISLLSGWKKGGASFEKLIKDELGFSPGATIVSDSSAPSVFSSSGGFNPSSLNNPGNTKSAGISPWLIVLPAAAGLAYMAFSGGNKSKKRK